jgi:hypothetical protein
MNKHEFQEVELDDEAKIRPEVYTVDYTADPKFKFCFLGLWCVSLLLCSTVAN